MTEKRPLIALVGRPNVGKSTLFNRLVGRRVALVHNTPGVTRDRKIESTQWQGLFFDVVDTPGLYDPNDQDLMPEILQGMRAQTYQALKDATAILFVVDGIAGCTPYDAELAQLLRKSRKPILVVVNKCESKQGEPGYLDALSFGLGDVIQISAEHGLGVSELYDFISIYAPQEQESLIEIDEETENTNLKPLRLMVIGRPNVGKSTLINALIGENRLLTADMPGVTRDSISLDWHYKGREITLVDSAGLRRSSKITDALEKLSVMDAKRALQYTDAAILVIDGTIPIDQHFEKQDFTLASLVLEEGRMLVLAINKWDLVPQKTKLIQHLQSELAVHFAQAKDLPIVPVSAKEHQNLGQLMEMVFALDTQWNRQLPTSRLNQWLELITQTHSPPAIAGRKIRLKFMTQKKSRPPTFVIHGNQLDGLPESYLRFLSNTLRRDFEMPGVPIRILLKNARNPYANKSS